LHTIRISAFASDNERIEALPPPGHGVFAERFSI
jgi:hypothetical protein